MSDRLSQRYSSEQIEAAKGLLEDATDGLPEWGMSFVPASRAVHAILRAPSVQDRDDGELLAAATAAAATLGAVYEWLDRVKAAGGATSISGVASCNAMLKSLESNRARCEKLVMQPLRAALSKAGAA